MLDFKPDEFVIAAGGIELNCYESISAENSAIILFIHGMADHSSRHWELASYLNQNNLGFATMDLPGHGKSARGLENLGNWPENGFNKLNEFIDSRINNLNKKYSLPIILLGHSLGSFIAIKYLCTYRVGIAACILSSPIDDQPPLLLLAGKIVAFCVSKIKGEDSKSKLLDDLSFGSFNKKFKPNRTRFDWICTNEEIVDAYIADDHSGIICSAGYFLDFAKGLTHIYDLKNLMQIPDSLPIHIFAGSEDPVSNMGEWVAGLMARLAESGNKDISFKVYEGMRHECMHEKNNFMVYGDIVQFCNKALKIQ